jgi:hypothetical protein
MATIANADRVVSYSPVASTGPFTVPFPVFDEEGDDLEITLNGELLAGWTFTGTIESGFYGAPNTWINGSISTAAPITGSLIIEGNRAPRRESQFAEGRGIPARDSNTELNTLTAIAREQWQRLRRAILVPVGETRLILPTIAARANKYLGFDGNGNMVPFQPNEINSGDLVDKAVTNQKLADMAAATVKGRALGAGTGVPTDLTGTQLKAIIGTMQTADIADNAITSAKLPAAGSAALRTLKTLLQIPLSIKDFGAVGDGTTDDTAAYNSFIAAVAASDIRHGYLPKGKYRLTSQPADISTPIMLYGDGPDLTFGTIIFRDYNGTANKGVFHLVPGCNGTLIRDMAVMAAAGTSGGRMLSVVATAGGAPPSFLTFENLYLSTYGTDTCVNTVYIDGSLRTTAPIGCRDLSFKNCHIFGSAGFSLVLNGVIGCHIAGGGVYPAGGTNAASGAIQITAPGSPFFSQYVVIDVVTCDGFNLTHTNGAQLRSQSIGDVSGVSINAASTANQIAVYGSTSGTSTVSWTNSGVFRPTGYATS